MRGVDEYYNIYYMRYRHPVETTESAQSENHRRDFNARLH